MKIQKRTHKDFIPIFRAFTSSMDLKSMHPDIGTQYM
jgi:hypothetical protein